MYPRHRDRAPIARVMRYKGYIEAAARALPNGSGICYSS